MTENDQNNNEEPQEEVYNIVTELRNAIGELPGFAWAVILAVLLLGVILVVQSNDALEVGSETAADAPVAVISPADEAAEADAEPVRDPNAPVSVISPAGSDADTAETEPERDPDAPVAVISPAETEDVEAEAETAETEEPTETEDVEAQSTEEPAATDAPEPTTAPEPTAVPDEAEDAASADADTESEVEALQARVDDLEEEIIAFQADATTRALQMESLRATVTAATSDE